jgi:hypothetical protein
MKPVVAALLLVSVAALAQPAKQTRFDPATDCDKTPPLIRDAAKDARISAGRVCYISDRARFAAKAGEPFARDLDRVGKLVRVAIPFGHLLLINGTEPAVLMAVRFYEAELRVQREAARRTGDEFFGTAAEAARYAAQAIAALRQAYAAELVPYR